MKFKVSLMQILHGSLAKRVILRTMLVTMAIMILPFLQMSRELMSTRLFKLNYYYGGCALGFSANPFLFAGRFLKPMSVNVNVFPPLPSNVFPPLPSNVFDPCSGRDNLTMDLFGELMEEKLLNSGAKALCFGEGSASATSSLRKLGFSDAIGVNPHSFFSFMRRKLVSELEFDDNSYDFVFSSDINRVSVPAFLVLEIERVLKPGGVGAMLVDPPSFSYPSNLIKSATPISSFLKNSDVVNVCLIRSFTVVVFKKKIVTVNPFDYCQLPDECPSVLNNKPIMRHLEPLNEGKVVGIDGNFSYLLKFLNVSSRKRFVYVDIGARDILNSNTVNWFTNIYPLQTKMFNVYVVDHDVSVLSSYVKRPGITFVYHPGLAGSESSITSKASEYDEGFDFLVWFRETVAIGDFVVLKMNTAGVELKLLHELFESGAICLVDELFLHCPNNINGLGNQRADCFDLIKGLRSSGVFVHQWMRD